MPKRPSGIPADEALQILLEGNRHFVENHQVNASRASAVMRKLDQEQRPIAVMVGCSDARVPPDVIFDTQLGDLFTIRTAGHIMGEVSIGTAEYAVMVLGVNLVVILGHGSCGAVTSALSDAETIGLAPVLAPIKAAIEQSGGGISLDEAIRLNTIRTAKQLEAALPGLKPLLENGTLKIVPTYYDLKTGAVELL